MNRSDTSVTHPEPDGGGRPRARPGGALQQARRRTQALVTATLVGLLAGLLTGGVTAPASAAAATPTFELYPFCEGTELELDVYTVEEPAQDATGYRVQVDVTTAAGTQTQVRLSGEYGLSLVFPDALRLSEVSVHVPGPAGGPLGPETLVVAFEDSFDQTYCASPFLDVPGAHPFFEEIRFMYDSGVSTGYPDGTYRPTLPVSREAMAAFMYRFADAGFVPPTTPTFRDVPRGSAFYREVEWMAHEGISTGFADGTFRPGAPVSRQAMSAFLYRLVDGGGYTPPASQSFADVPPAHPFYDSVEWMSEYEISTGYVDKGTTTYRPSATVSRQAMAAFLYRTLFVG